MSKHRLKLALLGSTGRMGKHVQTLIQSDYRSKVDLVCAPDRATGKAGIFDEIIESGAECILDFALPDAMMSLTDEIRGRSKKPMLPAFVVGSTGWSAQGVKKLQWLASQAPVVQTSNFSIGILLFRKLLKDYSKVFQDFGYDIGLVEKHHTHKKDAPSGTALMLAASVKESSGKSVSISSVRAGEIVGEHEVGFYGQHDEFVVKHQATSRALFAQGALETCLWIRSSKRSPRFYSMDEFLKDHCR